MLLCGNHNYKKSTFDLIVGNITTKMGFGLEQNLLFVLE